MAISRFLNQNLTFIIIIIIIISSSHRLLIFSNLSVHKIIVLTLRRLCTMIICSRIWWHFWTLFSSDFSRLAIVEELSLDFAAVLKSNTTRLANMDSTEKYKGLKLPDHPLWGFQFQWRSRQMFFFVCCKIKIRGLELQDKISSTLSAAANMLSHTLAYKLNSTAKYFFWNRADTSTDFTHQPLGNSIQKNWNSTQNILRRNRKILKHGNADSKCTLTRRI